MDTNTSNLSSFRTVPQLYLNSCNHTKCPKNLNLHPDCYINGLEHQNELIKSLVASHGNKKFESLEDYFLEVSKTLLYKEPSFLPQDQRQSFYSLNLADVLLKVQKWRNMLPGVEMFYAMKAYPDPVLLKLLVMLGISFDCATEGEIQAALKAGAKPSSILWAHTVKPYEGLLYAQSVGVDMMTFDDEEELRKIHKIFPAARLILRIQPSIVKCRFDLSDKFGCRKSEAERLLKLAKQLNMDVQGISFHVGALCTDPDAFSITIRDCKEIFEHAQRMGYCLSILDIGGGFFGASGSEPIFERMVKGIQQALKEHFSDSKVRVIAEPGSYVVGSAVNVVCTVIGKRTVEDESGVLKYYFMNNGLYSSFFRGIENYDIRAKPLLTENELKNRPEFESILFGQTCSNNDVIQKGARLPDLNIGECMMWENMGSYSSPSCITFCGVPLPATVYVFQKKEGSNSCDTLMNDTVREFLKEHAVFIGGEILR